jgi:hypothetical protein
MIINFSDQPVMRGEKSLFLIGPTPRRDDVPSWRPRAVDLLQRSPPDGFGFEGIVYVPERRNWHEGFEYLSQTEWEYEAISAATALVIWVPRHSEDLPGLTTNVEFGYWLAKTPERCFYGRPFDAPSTGYLDWLYHKVTGRHPAASLEETLTAAIGHL